MAANMQSQDAGRGSESAAAFSAACCQASICSSQRASSRSWSVNTQFGQSLRQQSSSLGAIGRGGGGRSGWVMAALMIPRRTAAVAAWVDDGYSTRTGLLPTQSGALPSGVWRLPAIGSQSCDSMLRCKIDSEVDAPGIRQTSPATWVASSAANPCRGAP